MRSPWSYSSLPGLMTGIRTDDAGRTIQIASVQDVEPILNANRVDYLDAPRRGDLRLVASIPNVIAEKWMKEENISIFRQDDWPKILAKLDDPEFVFLRTAPGRLSRRPIRKYPSLGAKPTGPAKPRPFWDGS